MPTFNDDAVYVGQLQTQFMSVLSGGETTVNWQFTIGASETFNEYDPTIGFVPEGFVLQGANFSVPISVVLSKFNASSVSNADIDAALYISGHETSGTAQTTSIWATYSK